VSTELNLPQRADSTIMEESREKLLALVGTDDGGGGGDTSGACARRGTCLRRGEDVPGEVPGRGNFPFVAPALTQLGIAVQLTANTYLILLGAIALAAAIAFGIGGQGVAREILEKDCNRSDEVTGGTTGQPGGAGGEGGGRPDVHRLQRNE
jgi:hypothetical protein